MDKLDLTRCGWPDDFKNRFTHADVNAQQLGICSQLGWKTSIDKLKFNQLVDDAAEKVEVSQSVNFPEFAKQSETVYPHIIFPFERKDHTIAGL